MYLTLCVHQARGLAVRRDCWPAAKQAALGWCQVTSLMVLPYHIVMHHLHIHVPPTPIMRC